VPGLVRPFGAGLLVREPSGELAVLAETGKKVRTLVPARCQGRLLHADGPRGLALVVCAKGSSDESGSLELHGAGRPVALGEMSRPKEDSWQPGQPRYVDLHGGRWVDLETRALVKTLPLAPGGARRVYDRERRQRGVHAVRADGAELTGPAEGHLGPLRWQRGKEAVKDATGQDSAEKAEK
jgi:hypothetical protein